MNYSVLDINETLPIIIKIPYPSILPRILPNKLVKKIDMHKLIGRNPITVLLIYIPKSTPSGKVAMATCLAFFIFKKITGMKYPKGINNKIELNEDIERNKIELDEVIESTFAPETTNSLASIAGTGMKKPKYNANNSNTIPVNTIVLFL